MSATLTPTAGSHYAIGDAVVQVLDVFENREHHGGPVEILVRANTEADGLRLGWGKAGTTYEAVFNVDDFLGYAEPTDAPVPYVPVDPAPTDTSTGAVTDHAPAPVGAPITHTLDRIPGEPNPLDVNPAIGFAKVWESELTGTEWFERPTVWITTEQDAALGSPQQITVTIGAVR